MFHRLVPFSSLASGEHREAFALIPGTCTVFALSPAHRSPSPSGTQQKASGITPEQAKEKLPLGFIGDAAPNVGRPQDNATPNFPPRAYEEGDVRTGNDECAHQTSTEKRRKRLKKKECRGASSLFVRRNEEKPGAFAE